jgi:hypothetical protein
MEDWEIITERNTGSFCWGDTCRLSVPGGWLYREREYRDGAITIALAFVPIDNDREEQQHD